ncbi:DNA primase [Entamoeba marina]
MDQPEVTKDVLRKYYTTIFPTDAFYNWITRNKQFSTNRELSFTLENDQYLRYLHFNNSGDFLKQLREKVPVKFDIGAIFNTLDRSAHIVAQQREFVIDIDMDEYNDVRYCCKGTDICHKCWTLLVCAAKVLNQVLYENFNFQHILNVFSGRRGIHMWVCDEAAMQLDDRMRSYIVKYLNLFEAKNTNEQNESFVKVPKVHDLFDKAYEILEHYFEQYLSDQEIITNDERRGRLLRLIRKLSNEYHIPMKKCDDCVAQGTSLKWDFIQKQFNDFPNMLKSIVFTYLYPRLDINVSISINHLLKAPFCIHPKTGKVCVPLDIQKINEFNPKLAPTIFSSLKDHPDKMEEENSVYPIFEYLNFFKQFVADLNKQ